MAKRVETRVEMLGAQTVQEFLYENLGEESLDPDVINFINYFLMVSRAEKQSNPLDWTPEEWDAYHVKRDWELFSRLRGYTEEEIAQFREYLRLHDVVEKKYPGISSIIFFPGFEDKLLALQNSNQ